MSGNDASKQGIREVVREGYARVATGESAGCCAPSCCTTDPRGEPGQGQTVMAMMGPRRKSVSAAETA